MNLLVVTITTIDLFNLHFTYFKRSCSFAPFRNMLFWRERKKLKFLVHT